MTRSVWTPEAANSLYASPNSRTLFPPPSFSHVETATCKGKSQWRSIPCTSAVLTTKQNVCSVYQLVELLLSQDFSSILDPLLLSETGTTVSDQCLSKPRIKRTERSILETNGTSCSTHMQCCVGLVSVTVK